MIFSCVFVPISFLFFMYSTDPRSSLLSIGRVPMINFLQNFSHFLAETPCALLHPRPYQISCRNTWGQPSEAHTFHKDISGQLGQVSQPDCLLYPLQV